MNLTEISKLIIEEAKKQGADNSQVSISRIKNIGTRFGENHITQNVSRNTTEIKLITQIANQIGVFRGTLIEDIPRMVNSALTLSRHSAADKDFPGFVEDQPTYRKAGRNNYQTNVDEISDTIKYLIDQTEVSDAIRTVAGNIHYIQTETVNLNSFDVLAKNTGSKISAVINMAAYSGENESRSSARVAATNLEDLQMDKTAERVAQKAVDGLNQQDMDTGRYETVLGPDAVNALWMFMIQATSAEALITHRSFLKDKIGADIVDKGISVLDATDDLQHYANRRFDIDLVPSEPIKYIDSGVLKSYAYNRRTAGLLGVESNGRNSTGFAGEIPLFQTGVILPGNRSEEDLISAIDDGIYITNLFYNNFVNAPEGTCTGLTKDGLFRIKNGEIIGSLKNFRWMDSILSIFRNAEAANNSVQTSSLFGGGFITPSIKVSSFNLSSKGKH